MFDDLIDIAIAILLAIFEELAELAVGEALADHRDFRRGQVPVRRAGRRVHAFNVMVLMASTAFQRRHAVSLWAPRNIHRVAVTVVSLPRKISRGVAIHTAWMAEHWNNGFKCIGCRLIITRQRAEYSIAPGVEVSLFLPCRLSSRRSMRKHDGGKYQRAQHRRPSLCHDASPSVDVAFAAAWLSCSPL